MVHDQRLSVVSAPTGVELPAAEYLRVYPLDGRPGWRLVGEVDLSTRALLVAALDLAVDQAERSARATGRTPRVHLDLAGLSFIDVGGVTVLVNGAGRLAPEGRLTLHHPPDTLRRIVDLLWVDQPELEMDPG